MLTGQGTEELVDDGSLVDKENLTDLLFGDGIGAGKRAELER